MRAVRRALLVAAVGFIASTVSAVKLGLQDYEDETGSDSDVPALLQFLDAEWARLGVGMVCAVAGAAVGNALAEVFEGRLGSDGDAVSRGTLCCSAPQNPAPAAWPPRWQRPTAPQPPSPPPPYGPTQPRSAPHGPHGPAGRRLSVPGLSVLGKRL